MGPRLCTRCVILAVLAGGLGGCLPSKDPYVYNVHTLTGQFPSESPKLYNAHTVTPGLLVRGGQPDAAGLHVLRDDFGVRTVVNLNHKTNDSEAALVANAGLSYLPLRDEPFNET